MTEHTHDLTADYICKRCGMEVMTYIPHECDISICPACDGKGHRWHTRTGDGYHGAGKCMTCGGSGKMVFKNVDT